MKSYIKFALAQKVAARKSIARCNLKLEKASLSERGKLLFLIEKEKKILAVSLFESGAINNMHRIKHSQDINEIDNYEQEDSKPRFGNLIYILEQDTAEERSKVEGRRFPSQNDLTRWALKDAVLGFYQGMNLPENVAVVDSNYDDRLTTELAPDFDVIYNIWMEKLDELQRRTDEFALDPEEYSKAEDDLLDGMRGSAFEKQLDRYREEFMQKLKR